MSIQAADLLSGREQIEKVKTRTAEGGVEREAVDSHTSGSGEALATQAKCKELVNAFDLGRAGTSVTHDRAKCM